MLRYKTETRPGLVALYDIRPGNERVHSYNPGATSWANIIIHYDTASDNSWEQNPVPTESSDVYKNDQPVDEERSENEERPQRLNEQQWHSGETFAGLVEQSHDQRDTITQYKQDQ